MLKEAVDGVDKGYGVQRISELPITKEITCASVFLRTGGPRNKVILRYRSPIPTL